MLAQMMSDTQGLRLLLRKSLRQERVKSNKNYYLFSGHKRLLPGIALKIRETNNILKSNCTTKNWLFIDSSKIDRSLLSY